MEYPTARIDFELIEKLQKELEASPQKTDDIKETMKELIENLQSYKNTIPSSPSPHNYSYSPALTFSNKKHNPYSFTEEDLFIGKDLIKLFEEKAISKDK